MKITRSQLKQLIVEELQAVTEDGHEDVPSAARKLKTAIEDATEILQGLQASDGDLPSWWMSKLTLASDYLNKCRDYLLVDGGVMEEVYSEKQRRWACAQMRDDFKGERTLTKKEAEEMCGGPMLKAKGE